MKALRVIEDKIKKLLALRAKYHVLIFENWRDMSEEEFIQEYRKTHPEVKPYDRFYVIHLIKDRQDVIDLKNMGIE